MKFLRVFALALLPIMTLALGFQIGMRYEQRSLSADRLQLERYYSVAGSGAVVAGDPEQEVNMGPLWSVWKLLQQYYIAPDQLLQDRMVFGAVKGAVDSLGDPYTLFMTPEETKAFYADMSGTLEGIGARLHQENGNVVVVDLIANSPAEAANILPGDIFVKADDITLTRMPLDAVISHIRGPKGTTVTLTIERKNVRDPVIIPVVRDSFHVPSVESKMLSTQSGSIALVTINQFGDTSMQEVRDAIATLKDLHGAQGLILDLRYNGGGYLDGAVELVSMFQETGSVVSVARRDPPMEILDVLGDAALPSMPLVVLMNQGSASASEIVAGALQDSHRATIVGVQSFGKGTVQEVLDLPEGSSLRVTTAQWITPAGHELNKKGVTPDIVIDRTEQQIIDKQDPQLDAAVEWLTDHEDVTKE